MTLNSMESPSPIYEIANNFAILTALPLFITGNAGTGKTTFLRKLRESTPKKMVIAAPTGVAAINAGGSTLHSLFQLPFTPFVPTVEGRSNLLKKLRLTTTKRRTLQEIEILVIDEISMVRADILDEIDTILRSVRFKRDKPFGGVQVIFIGDLFQLPPVAIAQEWEVLAPYYQNPFFFSSKVIQEYPPIQIELDTVFRQTDKKFINLLSQVRHNKLTFEGFEMLKSRFYPDFKIDEHKDYIFLTTHNKKANSINAEELEKIEAPKHTYNAKIDGEFPQNLYPNSPILELKLGAKVMFIANGPNYYNGKIGLISHISEDHSIFVKCINQQGEEEEIPVIYETWENIKYNVNPSTKNIEEKKIGSFEQIPLRLAWAITIHKSQGLTFDKICIDAEAAFSSGQVYVALSRCRSLEGIVLQSPIYRESLFTNHNVIEYSSNRKTEDVLKEILQVGILDYNAKILFDLFDFNFAMGQSNYLLEFLKKNSENFNAEVVPYHFDINKSVIYIHNLSLRFQKELEKLIQSNNQEGLKKRIKSACDYFAPQLASIIKQIEASPAQTFFLNYADDYNSILHTLFGEIFYRKFIIENIGEDFSTQHIFDLRQSFQLPKLPVNAYTSFDRPRVQRGKYPDLYNSLNALRYQLSEQNEVPIYLIMSNNALTEMATYLPLNNEDLMQISGIGAKKVEKYGTLFLEIITNYCQEHNLSSEMGNIKKRKTTVTPKPTTVKKTPTHQISFDLYKTGKNIQEIAKIRNLTEGTIETHLCVHIASGELNISELFSKEEIDLATELFNLGESLSSVFNTLEGNLTFGQLRMIRASIPEEKLPD